MNKPKPSEKSSPSKVYPMPDLKLGETLNVSAGIEENRKKYAEIKKNRPPGSVTVESLPDM